MHLKIEAKNRVARRVNLIGSYPPPYGGVSVHIQRLHELLSKNGVQCTVIDFSPYAKNKENVLNARKIGSWRYISSRSRENFNIHISGISLKKIMGCFLFSLLCKIRENDFVITLHSLRESSSYFNQLRMMAAKTFSKFFHYITVSTLIKNRLISLNVEPDRISVIPAFLPPSIKQRDIDEVSQELWNFINNHKPVISANAYRIAFYDNQDLYGIDMCIDLCANLKNDYPEVGLVLCLSTIKDSDYFRKMRKKIIQKGIEHNFLFLTQSHQFYPILMRSDVFVRPTNTDGDAVSIREALYFKIPTVASDVVSRPVGTVIFSNRDVNDFTAMVRQVLESYEEHKRKLEDREVEENCKKILSIYQQLQTK